MKPWNQTICKRRLKWFGHLMRLPETTPARCAFREILQKGKRKRGRPKTTWLALLKEDLKLANIEFSDNYVETERNLTNLTTNRKNWYDVIQIICDKRL